MARHDALREQRGDGHVAVLAAAGISGRESNVLHAAAGNVARDYIARTRDYDEAAWRHHEQRLAERGLLSDDGTLTAAGRELKDHIESSTDALSLSALDALSDDEVETLFRALSPSPAPWSPPAISRRDPDGVTPRRIAR